MSKETKRVGVDFNSLLGIFDQFEYPKQTDNCQNRWQEDKQKPTNTEN